MSICILISGCGKKEDIKENKTMEQIYREQGIPVKVETINEIEFTKSLKYTSELRGNKQTDISAMVSDKVEKIYAKTGSFVKENEVIITFPNNNPSASYQQALAAYNNDKKLADRMKEMLDEGGISQQDYDNVETKLEVSRANLEASTKALKVQAPFSGIITDLKVHEYEEVAPGTVLFTISDMRTLRAKVWVSESEICDVQPGKKAKVYWKDKILTGKVESVAMSKDSEMKAFHVELVFDNEKREVFCGSSVDIDLISYENDKAIAVKRQFIRTEDNKNYVWVNSGNKAVKREIKTGLQSDDLVEIIEGLQLGDKIIIEGIDLVYENAKLNVK
jgi:membrane fusion protein (multidrug efflux system)